MNQVLAKTQSPADAFAIELHRVVTEFVTNATDADVERLLEQASAGFSSRIETHSVIQSEISDFVESVPYDLAQIPNMIYVGALYEEASHGHFVATIYSQKRGSAADRQDLALAA